MNLNCFEIPKLAQQDVVFIHGNLASAAWWQPTVEEWRKAGEQGSGSLLLVDLRGCGDNPNWPASQKFTLAELAEDVLATLKSQGRNRVALVGHSLGGLLAIQLMIQEPQRFSSAVLLDPVGLKGVVFDDSMYEAFRVMGENRDLTRAVILNTIRNEEQLPESLRNKIVDHAMKAVKTVGMPVLEALRHLDLTQEAARIRIPTLILHGRHDQTILLKDSEETTRVMPSARLEILEEGGHCWNVENPREFTQRTRDWIHAHTGVNYENQSTPHPSGTRTRGEGFAGEIS